MESEISRLLFIVPAVKGVQFGTCFGFADLTRQPGQRSFCAADGRVVTTTNHNGGINGGITNGMPLVFSAVVKPTPSIYKQQDTVNLATMQPAS